MRLFGDVRQGFGADLAGPVEDQIFQPTGKGLVTDTVAPGSVHTGACLNMDGHPNSIGTQLAANDKDCQL